MYKPSQGLMIPRRDGAAVLGKWFLGSKETLVQKERAQISTQRKGMDGIQPVFRAVGKGSMCACMCVGT